MNQLNDSIRCRFDLCDKMNMAAPSISAPTYCRVVNGWCHRYAANSAVASGSTKVPITADVGQMRSATGECEIGNRCRKDSCSGSPGSTHTFDGYDVPIEVLHVKATPDFHRRIQTRSS